MGEGRQEWSINSLILVIPFMFCAKIVIKLFDNNVKTKCQLAKEGHSSLQNKELLEPH